MKTLGRYLIFHLPEWALAGCVVAGLAYWTEIPPLWLGLGVAAILIKDLALYPYVKSSYETVSHDPAHDLVGGSGRVVVPLDPEGWVELRHERWRARAEGDGSVVESGCRVRVCSLQGQILVVRREDDFPSAEPGE